MSATNLSLTTEPLVNGLVIEASAGTGKTYSVAGLVTRELANRENLRIGDILITTFTRNAAAELRDRVRTRLVYTARQLKSRSPDSHDELAQYLLQGESDVINARIKRLERAAVEFDSATISTIHAVCTKVLKAAGLITATEADDDITARIVAEVVNDAIVAEALAGRVWDESRIVELVKAMLSDPFIEPWFDPQQHVDASAQQLNDLASILRACVDRVHQIMLIHPSFNDLLRRAYEVVSDPTRSALIKELRDRFQLAIIDEAQDTDAVQWKFFRALFPPTGSRALVAVGDPKQSIYGFRGADVRAYMGFSATGTVRTLTTNYRSDKPVLDALNVAFDGAIFGPDISYIEVSATARHRESQIINAEPVEFVDLGELNNQLHLAKPTAQRVLELLNNSQLLGSDGPKPIKPSDICVLVRVTNVGRAIEHELHKLGIPAVSNGTESVMSGEIAGDIRSLLEAMERVSDMGRIRRAAGTAFFGYSLRNVGTLTDEAMLAVQNRIAELSTTLPHRGIAAWAAAISADDAMMQHPATGEQGERNITDFAHISEIMHAASSGRGCTPTNALEIFLELLNTDEKSDLVSRRVEGDGDAVKVMTIHTAKGLEFPCVIVADLWKPSEKRGSKSRPLVFYNGNQRVVDISFALGTESSQAVEAVTTSDDEESRRLLYVATTRAKHHLSVLVADTGEDNILRSVMKTIPQLRPAVTLPPGSGYEGSKTTIDAAALALAPAPRAIVQTYRRTSFTGITAARESEAPRDYFSPSGSGFDEVLGDDAQGSHSTFISDLPLHTIGDLPAGTAVGSQIHEIFENIDPTSQPLEAEVKRAVELKASSALLRPFHETLTQMIIGALRTPFGGPFKDISYSDISKSDRLAEMDFEMALTSLSTGVLASDIGEVLTQILSPDDPLFSYANQLRDASFNIPLGGLLNGSIDALLRLSSSTKDAPRLIISDYKSNKLHTADIAHPIEAYAPAKLLETMIHHHYPLQALLYGTAIYRMLRWRSANIDHDSCISGIAYGFIRGMVGPATPTDADGNRYGVFTWVAPSGMWSRLSDLFAGERP
ncbi:MAG: UvrD-helicase domain-containing protein [Ilumatobacteraceae bacterium]